MKLKIRFSKTLLSKLLFTFKEILTLFFGNDKNVVLDVNNPNTLGIRNNSTSPVKITMKPWWIEERDLISLSSIHH